MDRLKIARHPGLLAVTAALCLSGPNSGLHPRAGADSYPAHLNQPAFSIGAARITAAEAKKIFATKLDSAGYVAIEVGVYPSGHEFDLSPAAFTLMAGETGSAMRPVDAETIAEVIARPGQSQRTPASPPIDIASGVGIGRQSYPDPITGQQTSRTVTSTRSGVGIGAPAQVGDCRFNDCTAPYPAPPADTRSATQSAHAIEQELWSKGLPDRKTNEPVAGYLYFPKPSGKAKAATWELRYDAADRFKLSLPQ